MYATGIVLQSQTKKKDLSQKVLVLNFNLTISGHLEGLVSHKKPQYQNYQLSHLICIIILIEISTYHSQLKCMDGHFFLGHPYIEKYYHTLQ